VISHLGDPGSSEGDEDSAGSELMSAVAAVAADLVWCPVEGVSEAAVVELVEVLLSR